MLEFIKKLEHLYENGSISTVSVLTLLAEEELIELEFVEAYHTLVAWPISQSYMEHEGFEEHSQLLNSDESLYLFGSQAYLIDDYWLASQNTIDDLPF